MFGPVHGALTLYPDGAELYAAPYRAPSPVKDAGAKELQVYLRELRDVGEVEADRRAAERREERAERSAAESARRSCSKVRKVVRSHGLDHMVTLTFPGDGVHEYDDALRLLQHFMHDHGELVRLGGHYLAVPELHPNGHGWHWHLLVGRRFTKPELHALRAGWTAYLSRKGMEPTGGAEWVRINVKAWGTSSDAAAYAAKYVGKTFEGSAVGKGRRRYLVSLGATVERVPFNADSLRHVTEAVQAAAPDAFVLELEADEGRPAIVWATW